MTTDHEAIRRHRWRLAIPVAVAVLALGGYALLWLQGARIMRAEIAEWVAEERAAGREVAHGPIKVRGFPGTLRADIAAPVWSEPGVWSWRGERLFVITQPLNPSRILVTPRGPQALVYDGETYDLTADDLRLSFAEDRFAAEAAGLRLDGGELSFALGAGRVTWIENGDESAVLGLSFGQVALAAGADAYWIPQLNAALSENGSGELGLDAFEGAVSTGREADPALLSGEGRVGLDADGYPSGAIDVTLRNGAALTDVLVQAGALQRDQIGMASMVIAGFADAEGTAVVPFGFQGGRLRVGPLAVADLPRF